MKWFTHILITNNSAGYQTLFQIPNALDLISDAKKVEQWAWNVIVYSLTSFLRSSLPLGFCMWNPKESPANTYLCYLELMWKFPSVTIKLRWFNVKFPSTVIKKTKKQTHIWKTVKSNGLKTWILKPVDLAMNLVCSTVQPWASF